MEVGELELHSWLERNQFALTGNTFAHNLISSRWIAHYYIFIPLLFKAYDVSGKFISIPPVRLLRDINLEVVFPMRYVNVYLEQSLEKIGYIVNLQKGHWGECVVLICDSTIKEKSDIWTFNLVATGRRGFMFGVKPSILAERASFPVWRTQEPIARNQNWLIVLAHLVKEV